jgi:hypothetical protein
MPGRELRDSFEHQDRVVDDRLVRVAAPGG